MNIALNMDCMEYMASLEDNAYSLGIVDPPYGINAPKMRMGEKKGYPSTATLCRKARFEGAGKLKNRVLNTMQCEWDMFPPSAEYFKELFRVTKKPSYLGGNYFDLPPTRCIVVWDKVQPWENFSQVEIAWTSFDKPVKLFRCSSRGGTNREKKIHPTQKPVSLYEFIIQKFCKPGDTILDTHLGSGSSRIALQTRFRLCWNRDQRAIFQRPRKPLQTINFTMSYLSDRLAAYHITDKENTFKAEAPDNLGHFISTWKFFTETDKGDIQINYLNPDGSAVSYNHGNVQKRDFCRIRYADPEKHKGKDGKPRKYFQEPGTETIPFCTPGVIDAYRKGEELKMLFVVEGEFKAFSLSMLGLPAVGIGGVQNFRDAKKSHLHENITDIIKRCKVRNLILIYDRDCIEVHWKEGKDLAERPTMFYSALNTFNELLKPYDVQLYFAHVSEKADQKGVDDVLNANPEAAQDVINELTTFTAGMPDRHYVMTYLVTGISSFKIMQIFGLDSVESFYQRYQKELDNREFRWKSNNYYVENGKPVVSWMAKAKEYVRVGIDYYRRVAGIYGQNVEINLVPWKSTVIKGDFGQKFLSQVAKFDGFANIPENDPNKYRRVVKAGKDDIDSILYNIYSPVSHRPAEGEWKTINRLIHHIFDYKNCAGVPLYEMALDYLQLIYTRPAQHLPILCLVSQEQATGKTTFLQLLKAMFNENMRILDSKRLSGNFNSHWAGKLIVATDEAFLDTEKKEVSNTLKMIATNDTVPMEGKGKNAVEVSNFAKLIMCSNDEKTFAKIEAEDTRYWVIKVQSIPRDERDPHMADRMVKEIPAFLWFLKNRQMYYPEKTRLWFEVEDYDTPAHRAVQERTELGLVKHVKDVVKTQFFRQHCDKIRISLGWIYQLVEQQYKFADKQKIAEYLHDRGLTPSTATNFFVAHGYDPADWGQYKDRCYTFLASDWMTQEEIDDMNRKEEDQRYD